MAFGYAVQRFLSRSGPAFRLSFPGYFNPIYIPDYVLSSDGRLNMNRLPIDGTPRPLIYDVLHPILTTKRIFRLLTAPPTTKVIEPYLTIEKPDCIEFSLCMVGQGEEDVKVSVDGNTVFVDAGGDNIYLPIYGYERYNCWIDIPASASAAYNHKYKLSDIKADFMTNGGTMTLILPKAKTSFDVKINPV